MNASFGLGWDESVVSRYQEYKHGGSVGDQKPEQETNAGQVQNESKKEIVLPGLDSSCAAERDASQLCVLD